MTATLVAPRDGRKTEGMPTKGLWLAVGHPKSSKTSTFARFPGAYVLELEKNGADYVDGKGLRIHEIEDTVDPETGVVTKTALDTFGDVLELALNDDSISKIVIDTGDQLSLWIANDLLRNMGKDPASTKPDEKNFAFWDALKGRIAALVDYLKQSDKLIIVICHCRPPKTDEKGQIIQPAGVNIQGAGAAYLASHAEAICYISKRIVSGKPLAYASFNSPSDLAIWGSRVPELDGKEFVVPREDPYSAFAANFVSKAKPEAARLVNGATKKKK